jgi:hypothetical protein
MEEKPIKGGGGGGGARPIRKNQKINSPEEDAANILADPQPARPCRGSWTKAGRGSADLRHYFSLLCSFNISTFHSSFFFLGENFCFFV